MILETYPSVILKTDSETKLFFNSFQSHAALVAHINDLKGPALEQALTKVHHAAPKGRRNVAAGYVRAWSLFFGKLEGTLRNDPLFDQAFQLIKGGTLLSERRFMNFFLLLKYSLMEIPGDILEFGSFRCGTAIFLAYVARALGLNKTVYALDTFQGLPDAQSDIDLHAVGDFKEVSFEYLTKIVSALRLDNLVLVKGRFEDTVPKLSSRLKPLSLVHIDAVTYPSVKYAIDAAMAHLNPQGGYLVIDDVLCSGCMGTLQAVEEMVAKYDLNAEQTTPHFVYRCFQS